MSEIDEVAVFLKSRITAILFGGVLTGAFCEATFVSPNLIERVLLIVSSLVLGWFFCYKYYELQISFGGEEITERRITERRDINIEK
jgi:hypothetical protein